MLFVIKNPKPFQAAVILRTLYFSTNFDCVDVVLESDVDKLSLVRYSRVPVEVIKQKIKFISESNYKEPIYVLDPKSNLKIEDVKDVGTIIIDFSGKEKNYDRVKALGLPLLHYEAVALIYKIFIKNFEKKVPNFDQEVNKDLIYVAKKLLDGLSFFDCFPIVQPRLIVRVLRHVYKKYKMVIDCDEVRVVKNHSNVKLTIDVSIYNNNLCKVGEDKITLYNYVLEIPLFVNGKIKKYKLFVDYDKGRIYLSKKFFISKEDTENREIIPSNFL